MEKKSEFIKYANSFQAIAKLRLESIRALTELLGNPQDSLKFIHIAGTNGKGSVCSFLQNILTDAGYKTGKYTSPNMLRVNERICIDGKEISDSDLEEILKTVEEKANQIQKNTGDLPTQFEIWTAAAFCYFKEKKCDYVVLETGLGGTRDATNIIKNPVITVITQIAKDHTEYLGETLCEIAGEKAGIIKKSIYGGVTITVNQKKEVLNVLKATAINSENAFIVAGEPTVHDFTPYFEEFDYDIYKNLKISLLGRHQAQNASLAIECAKKLKISEEFIRSGLLKATNSGRLDIISKSPLTLFDGAHNKNGMASLSDALKRCFSDKKICFIMGFMRDKDIKGAIEELLKAEFIKGSEVFTVAVKNNPRSCEALELSEILSDFGFKAHPCNSIKDAYEQAKKLDKMIVICGSLYLYKDLWEENQFTIC